MTEEEKELLLKDLCARLPYGVQGVTSEGVITPLLHRGEADWDILTSLNYRIVKHGWRPYLRLQSSMTEEEKKIYESLKDDVEYWGWDSAYECEERMYESCDSWQSLDYLNSIHVNYRLPDNLYVVAPTNMYNHKIN